MWAWLYWWRPPAYLQRVIVNFTHTESEALEGILYRKRGPWLILRQASALKAGEPPRPMVPDEVHIPQDRIAFLQVSKP